jgi:hypothetical protein
MLNSVLWIRIIKDPEHLPDIDPALEGYGPGSIFKNGCKFNCNHKKVEFNMHHQFYCLNSLIIRF